MEAITTKSSWKIGSELNCIYLNWHTFWVFTPLPITHLGITQALTLSTQICTQEFQQLQKMCRSVWTRSTVWDKVCRSTEFKLPIFFFIAWRGWKEECYYIILKSGVFLYPTLRKYFLLFWNSTCFQEDSLKTLKEIEGSNFWTKK